MLQPSSGMSALSLPYIRQPSAPKLFFFFFFVGRCRSARFQLCPASRRATEEAQSWETLKGGAIQRSGCCMGVALFWCLYQNKL